MDQMTKYNIIECQYDNILCTIEYKTKVTCLFKNNK